MKTTVSILIMLAVIAVMAVPASAHHQKIGTKTIVHSLPPVNPNLSYEGNMTAKESFELLTANNPGTVAVLDIRSPWERNGSQGGCITQVALGIWIDPLNAGTPYWQKSKLCSVDMTDQDMPVHLQGPVGLAFNAQLPDGTDLVGWPFRAVGFMIMNPDFDNYLLVLEAEGLMAKSKPTIVMCASGWRAKFIAHYLKKEKGYTKVYVMEGGLAAWKKSGFPVSTNEADWQVWAPEKLYNPSRLASPKWLNSVYLKGGDPVIPEWMGDYVPPTSMVGYFDPTCAAPVVGSNNVGLNGPWPRDKQFDELGIVPTLTSVTLPAGWEGPTLNSQCIQTMMGFHGMDYPTAVLACASAPAVVPGYFNAWPIQKGFMIEGADIAIKGQNDPCGDMYTDFFGTGWYPEQNYCEQRSIEATGTAGNIRYCNDGDPLCSGTRTYCYTRAPFGYPTSTDYAYCGSNFNLSAPCGGFTTVTAPDGQSTTPAMVLKADFLNSAP